MSQDPSPFQDRNPFEVLGLRGTEDLPTIRKAFLRIAAQSHPDRFRMKPEEEKAQALETFLLAKKAFEVLSQPDKRREWSERLAPARPAPTPAPGSPLPEAVALQSHKLGMLALEASDYATALEQLSRAAKLAPTPRHQALELVARGHQYLSTRFLERARESFERALQLLPECREARAGLALLDKQTGRR